MKLGRTTTKLVPALLLAAGLSGCVTTKQVDDTNAQLAQVNQNLAALSAQVAVLEARANKPAPKPAANCLLGGQPYSPGSVVAGRICADTRGIIMSNQPAEWGWVPHTTNTHR